MDCIVYNDYHFSTNVERYFVCKMEIFADKLLPVVIDPLLFKSRFGKYGSIVDKRFQPVVKTIFFAFYRLIAEGVPMTQN